MAIESATVSTPINTTAPAPATKPAAPVKKEETAGSVSAAPTTTKPAAPEVAKKLDVVA